jgi:hypothetical protein
LILLTGRAEAIDVVTPMKYTTMLMAVEFAILTGCELNDHSISSTNFKDTWRDPTPRDDDDSALYNFLLHPLMGSETYLRAREGDFGVARSVAFSMAASLTWEYLIESWTEHPSTQDLVLTTGVGWFLGEVRYQIKKYNTSNNLDNFWVDPIWTTLEYFDFRLTRNGNRITPVIGLAVPF